MLAGALAPGLIAGDRPFQTSLCDDLEPASTACAPLERTLSAALRAGGADLAQQDEANGAPMPSLPLSLRSLTTIVSFLADLSGSCAGSSRPKIS
jgi:hypothetical protein